MSIHSVVMANTTTSTAARNDPIASVSDTSDQAVVKHPAASQSQCVNKNEMHSFIQSTMASKSNTHNPSASGHTNTKHHPVSLAGVSIKGREFEEPATKVYMKSMSARALWQLCKGNLSVCKSITESRALLCFSVLIEKGTDEVQYHSAMALMEIVRVAEQHSDLRRSAFKPSSPAARAVVDQILRIVKKADDDLLVPCIVALGCLSRTFRATETRIIAPLVKLLDETEAIVAKEAAIALTKFACSDNYLHLDHSKAIINEGGTKHLVQLVYFGEHLVQISALILLCYIALHVPDREALAQAEVLTVLEWSSKQVYMVQDPTVDHLLPEAKVRLELYQARGSSRGYH